MKAFAWSAALPENQHEFIVPMFINVYSPDDPGVSGLAADYLAQRAPGDRGIIFINRPTYDLLRSNPAHRCIDPVTNQPLEDNYYQCPWLEAGRNATRAKFDDFFYGLFQRGVVPDVMMVNYETTAFDFWARQSLGGMATRDRFLAIQRDPRFTLDDNNYPPSDPRHRSIAAQLGISNLDLVFNWRPPDTGPHYAAIWNSLMFDRFAAYQTEAIYDAATPYFPNIKISDNPTNFQDPSYGLPDAAGSIVADCRYPNHYCSRGRIVGNVQNPTFGYDPLLGVGFQNGTVKFDGVRVFESNPFNALIWAVNKHRISKYSDAAPVSSTVACRSHAYGTGNQYYAEGLLHLSLLDMDDFFFWNTSVGWTDIVNDCPGITADNEILNRVLREFNMLAGFEGRQSLDNQIVDWYGDFILSGISSGGRHVWRLTNKEYPATPDRPAITRADTLISTNPLVFRTGQKIITFPGGILYNPPNPSSDLGFWIVQRDSDPLPIITDDGVNYPPRIVSNVYQRSDNGWVCLDVTRSTDTDGTIVEWSWDYNLNGIQDLNEIGAHNNPNPCTLDLGTGQKSVRLVIRDNEGAMRTGLIQFTIPAAPCQGLQVSGGGCILSQSVSQN